MRLGFVDVPGHERFVKNMLAGVGGIDLVLFVIAADESIKPQTREHFDICRLLGIPRGIIALTKADLVDADILGLVRLEVEELVAGFVPGRRAHGAGQLGHRRGARRAAQANLARAAAAVPEKNAAGHFRLPIDRVFSVKGFGTVATGTLISGSVDKEQEVEVYPARPPAARARRGGARLARRPRRGRPAHGRQPGRYRARGVGARRRALRAGPLPRREAAWIAGWICCARPSR